MGPCGEGRGGRAGGKKQGKAQKQRGRGGVEGWEMNAKSKRARRNFWGLQGGGLGGGCLSPAASADTSGFSPISYQVHGALWVQCRNFKAPNLQILETPEQFKPKIQDSF